MSAYEQRPFSSSKDSNWVARSGGLPPYIRELARGMMKSGMTKDHAIAAAFRACEVWAAGGGGVKPDTRAKAVAALADWAKTRARNAAMTAAKKAVK